MFSGDIKVRMEGAHGSLSLGDPTEKTSPEEAPLLLSQKHSHKGQNRRAFSRGLRAKVLFYYCCCYWAPTSPLFLPLAAYKDGVRMGTLWRLWSPS